jgi:hypothetical protein
MTPGPDADRQPKQRRENVAAGFSPAGYTGRRPAG